jgi:hypothetical protein
VSSHARHAPRVDREERLRLLDPIPPGSGPVVVMRISRFAHPVDQACAASPEVIPPARQHRKPSRARSGPLSSVGPTPLAFGLPRGDGGRPNRARHPSPATAPPLRAVVRPIFEPSSLTRTGSCRQRVVLDRVARPSPHERRHPGASPFGNQPARRCTPRALAPLSPCAATIVRPGILRDARSPPMRVRPNGTKTTLSV